MLPWVVVMPALSLVTVACLHRTTPATKSVWMTSVASKPVVRNVKPALVLVLSSDPARYSAAPAAVAVVRVSVPLGMARVLVPHPDQAHLRNKRRRRLHTSMLSGE